MPRYEIIVAEGGGENVYQHPDGWWCAADDVARLEAENARLREGLAKYGDDSRDTIDGLTEENERLREALEIAERYAQHEANRPPQSATADEWDAFYKQSDALFEAETTSRRIALRLAEVRGKEERRG